MKMAWSQIAPLEGIPFFVFKSYLTGVDMKDRNWASMSQHTTETESEVWLEIVRQKVGAMRFGSVQIIVHEGRVTQVESTEKTRFSGETTQIPAKK